MRNIVFVLCEGPHDVAFLYRILKAIGFETYSEKIKNFPAPLNDFISQSVQRIAVEEMKLEEIRQRPIPSEVLIYRNQTLFLMYSVHGDSKKPIREEIIKSITAFIPTDPDELNPLEGLHLALLYFFDADNVGVSARLSEVKTELHEFLGRTPGDETFMDNGSVHIIDTITYGAYIFAGGEGKGKLEDILLPLMIEENEEIFEKAVQYLELKDNNRLKKLKIAERDGLFVESRTGEKLKFDLAKSEICIAGQLQNSGKSNVVIIKDCDYITLHKIQASPACREIIAFFRQVL